MKNRLLGLACALVLGTGGPAAAQSPTIADDEGVERNAQLPESRPQEAQGDLGACKYAKAGAIRGSFFTDYRRETTNDIIQSYVGEPAPVLVSRWGAPSRAYDNRDGSRILTWVNAWSGCTQTILIDPQDIVSRWRYSGCNCLRGRVGPPKGTPVPPMTL